MICGILTGIGLVALGLIYIVCWVIWCKWQFDFILSCNRNCSSLADLPTEKAAETVGLCLIGFLMAPIAVPAWYTVYALGWLLKEMVR